MQLKKRGRKKIPFALNLKSYLGLMKISLLSPTSFPTSIIERSSLVTAISYFSINGMLALISFIIFNSYITGRYLNLFLGVSQMILYIPILLFVVLLIATALHFLSQLFRGKSSFSNIFKTVCFCSGGGIIFWVPYLQFIGIAGILFTLLANIASVNNFSQLKSLFVVSIPIILGVLLWLLLFAS